MLCYQWLQTNKTKICYQSKLRHNSEPLVAFWQIVICERAGRERAWDAKRKVLLQVLFISSFSVLWSVLWSACEMMDGQETGRRQWSASGLLQTTGAFKLKKKAYYPDRIWTSTSFQRVSCERWSRGRKKERAFISPFTRNGRRHFCPIRFHLVRSSQRLLTAQQENGHRQDIACN